MKRLYILLAAFGLLVLVSGCEVTPGYGGSYGVYGEYPTTYYGDYYYPAYPNHYGYGHWDRRWDRDHYWDRGHWERHPYHYRSRVNRDEHHH